MRASGYLDRVRQLLSDIDSDDRQSVLSDLEEQLAEIGEGNVIDILGSPEGFVDEYRRSAGLATEPPPVVPELRTRFVANIGALLVAPLALLMLLSMGGGQFIFGPALLALGWFLCLHCSPSVRALWSIVAGLLTGQIVYLLVVSTLGSPGGQSDPKIVFAMIVGLVVLVLTALAFWRTTEMGPSAERKAGFVPVAAMVIGGLSIVYFSLVLPASSSGATSTALIAGSLIVVGIVALIVWLSARRTE